MTRFFPYEYGLEVGMLTDTGNVRTRNEDSIVVFQPRSPDLKKKGVLAVVADGMGGHSSGNVASRMAVDLLGSGFYGNVTDRPLDALKKSFIEANKQIYEQSLTNFALNGMGTTATALVLKEGRAYFVHVGDSRLYRLHGNVLNQISEDQTLVRALLKQGVLTKEQSESFPERNIITSALGSKPELLEMEICKGFEFIRGDQFLLCSDGLHDLVTSEEMKEIMTGNPPQAACDRLVELVKNRGAHDNASLIIIKIVPIKNHGTTLAITRF
jgi:protein phosphatase